MPTQRPLLQMDKQNHKLICVGTECVSSTSQRPHHSHECEFFSINLSELSVIAEHIQVTHPPTFSCHVGETPRNLVELTNTDSGYCRHALYLEPFALSTKDGFSERYVDQSKAHNIHSPSEYTHYQTCLQFWCFEH